MADRKFLVCALLGLLATAVTAQESKPAATDWAGDWIGTLDVGAAKLRLAFHITRKGETLSATMDSLDQGANGIPATEATATGESIVIRFTALNGEFEGKRSADFGEISGTWTQNGHEFPLSLKRGAAEPPKRSQMPKPPFPYEATEVEFDNPKAAGVRLAGTLTLPRGAGPFPAVILITGSGPQDRDESLMGHKPFLVLADHLTRNGIAVLRYDDRGVGASKGTFKGATTDDFASDAEAAVEFLKTRKDIDAKQIGLLGHSEGGLIAPIVAARNDDAAFIVLLAGPGLPGEQILNMQRERIAKASGAPQDAIEFDNRIAHHVMSLMTSKRTEDEVREDLGKFYDSLQDERRSALGDRETFIKTQSTLALDPWFRHFMTFDPRPTLAKVRCPMFALYGTKDLQVPANENLVAVTRAVQEGGVGKLTAKALPDLNHLFQKCETGSPTEYATIEETMNPTALDAITEWILKTTKRS